MSDEIAVERARPSDSAFEEPHLELRKAARHAAHEHRLANCLARGGEMPDVVVDEIGRRLAQPDAARTRMKRRRDSQLDAFRPYRIVVVLAVEPEHVEPLAASRPVRSLGRNLPPHHARHHHDFQSEFLHHVLEFLACLFGSVHRDYRRGRHAIGKLAEKFRDETIERAAGRATRLVNRDETERRARRSDTAR